MADTVRSEDVLGEKWDRCLTDGAIKLGSIAFHYYGPLQYPVLAWSASLPGKLTAALCSEMRALHLANSQNETGGVGLGAVFSLFFFKRKVWPVAFGAGLGLGIGYANCQNDIQSPYLLRSKKIVSEASSS